MTSKPRSGNMFIPEENKSQLLRKVQEYDASMADKFPPNKSPIANCRWAFKLEPMTSSFKTNGDNFEWMLPKKYIEEATN